MKKNRVRASILLIIMVLNTFFPSSLFGLSGGNKAPELESFQALNMDNLVNASTGDFSYNIPLMNVGFHGINLFYQAGITMDQEATMVGLGWNINAGVIDRNVRGIPDDFDGDEIIKKLSTKPYTTFGASFSAGSELYGVNLGGALNDSVSINASLGIYHNSYDGIGFEYSLGPSLSLGLRNKSSLSLGLGINGNSDGGISLNPSVNFEANFKKKLLLDKFSGFQIGTTINSKAGLQNLSLSIPLSLMERKNFKYFINLGNSISFSKPSFIQEIDFPRKNRSFRFNGKVGAELFGLFENFTVSGYYSSQFIDDNEIAVPGYGTLYIENSSPEGIQDFHRRGELPPSVDIPNLAIPIFDKDVYTVAGPGLSGSMEISRSDFGIVRDRLSQNSNNAETIGLEAGPGTTLHTGLDPVLVHTSQSTSAWSSLNSFQNLLSFKSVPYNQVAQEKPFLKSESEVNVEIPKPNDLFEQMHGLDVFRPNLTKIGQFEFSASGTLKSMPDLTPNLSMMGITGKRNERLKRSNNVTYHTYKEAKTFGFSRYLGVYNNLQGIAKNHHIAEIIVENEDGYKYVYGIPVYNLEQTEETFSVDGTPNNLLDAKNTGLIIYNDTLNSIENKSGKDHFYAATKIPPYASSYLLTAILSKDYQDLTGDGPSNDDFGDFVRFEYVALDNYSWKTPTSEPLKVQASLNVGFESDYGDDKASIISGVRQQYRTKSIVSKTERADYDYYENRLDGYGSDGQPNGVGALKSIIKYVFDENNAWQKLKSVYFDYDYSLCEGVYNNINVIQAQSNDKGKLTLKKVYILNGDSEKGKFSPYEFYYNYNPKYQPKAVNRYAAYQPRDIRAGVDTTISNQLCTVEFPYVPQEDINSQNLFAGAWSLNRIILPSGGELNVEYEADDYAYVQDKAAMQMIEIKGFSEFASSPLTNLLRDRNYIHFEIKNSMVKSRLQGASQSMQKDILKEYYLKDIPDTLLYYRVKGELKPAGNFGFSIIKNDPVKETVPGWAKIDKDDYGVNYVGGQYIGYIKLKEVCLEERKVFGCVNMINPITKTLMQALRLNLPDYLYGTESYNDDGSEAGIISLINSLTTHITQAKQVFAGGVNNWMNLNNYGNQVDLEKSFIRLYCPSKAKLSGSHRVSRIIMKDNFGGMTNNVHPTGIYGKQYEYTTTETILGVETPISSGVAAYEPAVGGDENPFFMAIPFKEEFLFAPDNSKYQEEPMMEDYFPGPQITYSKVTVRDLYVNNGQIEVYANTGFSESHFYTYKDYPIKTEATDFFYGEPYKTRSWIPLKFITKDYLTGTQGYFIHHTMMAGSPKANYTFNSSGQLIAGQEMYYKTNVDGSLSYQVPVLNQNLEIVEGRLGLSYGLIADSREHESSTKTMGVNVNLDIAGVVPLSVPTTSVFPEYSDEKTRFRSLVLVKSIRQQGILEKTVAINGSSRISTEHLLWDAETAQPIVSRTYNEFDDPIYNVNMPAHHAYKSMGQAYQNIYTRYSNISANNGLVTLQSGNNHAAFIAGINVGDVIVEHNSSITPAKTFWVLHKTSNGAFLIDKSGFPATFSNLDLRIEDSGFSNEAGAGIASYVMRSNPIVGNKLEINAAKEIIDAKVSTYSDKWQTFCNYVSAKSSNDCNPFRDGIVNPFVRNVRGQWRPNKSYVFQTDRKASNDIRVDGTYIRIQDNYNNAFANFWQETNGMLGPVPNRWTWTSENTLVSPIGVELEAKDPLNRYSAELYGYNQQKVIAVAANARYNEIAYYGAEVPLINGVDSYGLNESRSECKPAYHIKITDGIRKRYNDEMKPNSGEYYMQYSFGWGNILEFQTRPLADSNCQRQEAGPYIIDENCDCIPGFRPTQGKKYLLSAWLHAACLQDEICGMKPFIQVDLSGGQSSSFRIQEYGPVIEGWRKVSGTFTIEAGQSSGKISIQNSYSPIGLDDIRIHPYNATMKTYNYDPKTMRFTFEHDDNNFYTRYDYALDGSLQRVNKQTERGLQTLQESTFSQQKQ